MNVSLGVLWFPSELDLDYFWEINPPGGGSEWSWGMIFCRRGGPEIAENAGFVCFYFYFFSMAFLRRRVRHHVWTKDWWSPPEDSWILNLRSKRPRCNTIGHWHDISLAQWPPILETGPAAVWYHKHLQQYHHLLQHGGQVEHWASENSDTSPRPNGYLMGSDDGVCKRGLFVNASLCKSVCVGSHGYYGRSTIWNTHVIVK